MIIQMLSAEYGDAIVIRTMAGGKLFTIVVDGGPETTAENIVPILQDIGKIDLMVLTHFDEDHIMGLIKYVEQYVGEQLPVKMFWCNCAQKIDLTPGTLISDTGYKNANTLATFLRQQGKNTLEFTWTEDVTSKTTPFVKGDLRIDVLSPSETVLKQLKEEYEKYVKEHEWSDVEDTGTEIALVSYNPDKNKTIDELVKTDRSRRVNLWNKASIAFLLQAEGKKILMLGDADADIVADGLESLIGKGNSIDVDLVKLSHHGSKHNISKRLLALINSYDYAISTNGGDVNFCHPDRKTLALVARSAQRDPQREVNFYFNYEINKIEERTGTLMSVEEQRNERCNLIERATIEL